MHNIISIYVKYSKVLRFSAACWSIKSTHKVSNIFGSLNEENKFLVSFRSQQNFIYSLSRMKGKKERKNERGCLSIKGCILTRAFWIVWSELKLDFFLFWNFCFDFLCLPRQMLTGNSTYCYAWQDMEWNVFCSNFQPKNSCLIRVCIWRLT